MQTEITVKIKNARSVLDLVNAGLIWADQALETLERSGSLSETSRKTCEFCGTDCVSYQYSDEEGDRSVFTVKCCGGIEIDF